MTTALKNIFSKIDRMPVTEQNALASLLKRELEWQQSFDKSQNELTMLAAEALTEYKKGKPQPMKIK